MTMTTMSFLLTLLTKQQQQELGRIQQATESIPAIKRVTITDHDVRAELQYQTKNSLITIVLYNQITN